VSNNGVKLTDLQLEIICHLCNGLTQEEIAKKTFRSITNVQLHLTRAKNKTGARSVPHLVSIVIASGALVYTPDGERAPAEAGPPVADLSASSGSPAHLP
jgi:DNA-binding CsgD family transcriptional regulator